MGHFYLITYFLFELFEFYFDFICEQQVLHLTSICNSPILYVFKKFQTLKISCKLQTHVNVCSATFCCLLMLVRNDMYLNTEVFDTNYIPVIL